MNVKSAERVRPGILRVLAAVERRVGGRASASDATPADAHADTSAAADVGGPWRSIVEAFPNATLAELLADQTPASIYDPQLAWLDLPPEDFVDWVMNDEPDVWHPMPPSADFFGSPTFSQVQAHRLWLTIEHIRRRLPGPDGLVIDVGAYPFGASVAMRRYLGYEGRIVATVNQHFDDDVRVPLQRLGIEDVPVNLDPLLAVSTHLRGMTERIPVPDASADLVVLAHVIEHLYQPIHLLREISRVLRPGGAAIVTTDNAFMLHALVSQLHNAPCLHEPVGQTAAMLFDDWRGHVRFFTADDLRQMADAAGLDTVETEFAEVLYASVPEAVFPDPIVHMPAWRARILTAVPSLRNDVAIVAVKR